MSLVWQIEDAYLDFISLRSTGVDFRVGREKEASHSPYCLYGACNGIMEMNVINWGKERGNHIKS